MNTFAYGNGSQSLFSFWHGPRIRMTADHGLPRVRMGQRERSLSSVLRRLNKNQPKGQGESWRTNGPEMSEGEEQRKSRTGKGLSLVRVANAEQSSQTRSSWDCSLWMRTKRRV